MRRVPAFIPTLVAVALATAAAVAVPAGAAQAAHPADEPAPATVVAPPGATEVRVERVRPKRVKHPTLQFLRANRDFIRSRYDRLRERPDGEAHAEAIDPRYLNYAAMLAAIQAAQDSVTLTDEARRRQELFASITELGRLEDQLDQMDRLLAAQQVRLATLEQDFTGRQETGLVIVLRGYPAGGDVAEVAIGFEDGTHLDVALATPEREALRRGGVVQLYHAFVEPREQVFEIAFRGEGWTGDDTGFVTLEPARDRLTFLELDLSGASAGRGAASVHATTWLHQTKTLSTGG
jgi:hypothetical protein